jgi:hydroxymethylpyrimidine pyrophosphatase-like HAD family hydrolase
MCRKLGIDIADSIACGDAENDLPMIQTAGIGVAMVNGTAEAKAAANYVTEHDNNHDGIAEVVEKFLLSQT